MFEGVLLPFIGVLLIFTLILSAVGNANERRYTTGDMAETAKKMHHKRDQIRSMYPSDMSWRGFLCDSNNQLPENLIAYLVTEGDNLYVVYDEDMQTKFQIPIRNIIRFDSIKLNKLKETTTVKIPAIIPYSTLPVFLLEYVDIEGKNNEWYFFFEGPDSSSLYNKPILGHGTVLTYVNTQISDRKKR